MKLNRLWTQLQALKLDIEARLWEVENYSALMESCFSKWEWGPYECMYCDYYLDNGGWE